MVVLTAMAVLTVSLTGASAGPSTRVPTTATHASTSSSAARTQGDLSSRVIGTFGRNGTVRGTFTPERFFKAHGAMKATGTLNAVLKNGSGDTVGHRTKTVTLPVRLGHSSASRAQCTILHLVLGPLDLNLLGLKVHLNRVVLDVTAVSGPGNLLGNLLCAIAHLLDGTPLNGTQLLQLANLLNRILNLVG